MVISLHTLTLFKTNITDFPTLFRTEFRFLIPCLSQWKSILIHIRDCKNFAAYRPRQDILFKTKIDKSIPWLRQKMINSIPCLRQKSRKTYPGWPHVPIKGVPPPAPCRQPMTVFTMSLWTRNPMPWLCLSALPMKYNLWPSSVDVLPKFFCCAAVPCRDLRCSSGTCSSHMTILPIYLPFAR